MLAAHSGFVVASGTLGVRFRYTSSTLSRLSPPYSGSASGASACTHRRRRIFASNVHVAAPARTCIRPPPRPRRASYARPIPPSVNREIGAGNSPPTDFSSPFSLSVSGTVSPDVPLSEASIPAGAFHTPRCVSVLAMTPATIRKARMCPLPVQVRGRNSFTRGKYSAAFRAPPPFNALFVMNGTADFAQSFPAPSMPPADRPAAPLAALRSTATRCCRSHQAIRIPANPLVCTTN